MIQTKICTKCKEEKLPDEFNINNNKKDGRHTQCKLCHRAKARKYFAKNITQIKQNRKKYYHENLDKMRAEKRKYYAENKDKKHIYDIEYRRQNKTKIAQFKKEWEKKRANDPIFKIKRNLRRRVHHVLKGCAKADKTFSLIGCSAEEFKLYIESLWLPGMSWENYGPKGWHIDHIIPCYKFDLSKEEEQRKCFHYTNQRPLWAKDNLSRSRD